MCTDKISGRKSNKTYMKLAVVKNLNMHHTCLRLKQKIYVFFIAV